MQPYVLRNKYNVHMKIFYSWQTDAEEQTCKDLIHNALIDAAKDVSEQVEIDHDTKRVLGSPNIVDVITKKIEAASVIVADVTLTGRTVKPDGEIKKQINSNVATELGYALGAHSDRTRAKDGAELLIKVMNIEYGDPAELPFDVRDRHPLMFKLASGATKAEWKKARDDLKNQLFPIIKGYYEIWKLHPSQQPTPFKPTLSTIHDGAYWKSGQLIVNETDSFDESSSMQLKFADDQGLVYLRLSPVEPIQPIKFSELPCTPMLAPFMAGNVSFSYERNSYGQIWFTKIGENSTSGTTQLFKSREIWGICPLIFKTNDEQYLHLPSQLLIDRFTNSLQQYSEFTTNHLGYHKAAVEAGIVNIAEKCLFSYSHHEFLHKPRLIHNDIKLKSEFDLAKTTEISVFCERFFDEVYEEAGVTR